MITRALSNTSSAPAGAEREAPSTIKSGMAGEAQWQRNPDMDYPLGNARVNWVRFPAPANMNINSITTTTPMPLRSDWHVVPKGALWALKQEHRGEYWGMYLTQQEAIGAGITQAREGYTSLIIHGRDGTIKNVWSYDDAIIPFG